MAPAALIPVQILAGPEAGKRAACIAARREALRIRAGGEPEFHRFQAQDLPVRELLLLLRNGTLFAGGIVVEYRGAESIKAKADVQALVAYIGNPAENTLLFLVSDSFSIERQIEDAAGKAAKTTFFEMFENEKPAWIRAKLAAMKLSIDEDGIAALLELVENETGALETACLGLSAGFPPGSTLGATEVEAAIARNRSEDAFSLLDRMFTGDAETALAVFDAVFSDRQGGAVQIAQAIVWGFRRLGGLHALVSGGTDFSEACNRLAIRSKTAQRQQHAAMRRYSGPACARILAAASEADGLLRVMGTTFDRQIMHALVLGIMEGGGRVRLDTSGDTFL